jgi:hypothetical protein
MAVCRLDDDDPYAFPLAEEAEAADDGLTMQVFFL